MIDQYVSILDHATVLPYHVLSPVLQNSSFRSGVTPPSSTSEFIYNHPAYKKLCSLDADALARAEAKHPVLGPIIDNIKDGRANNNGKKQGGDKAKHDDHKKKEKEKEDDDGDDDDDEEEEEDDKKKAVVAVAPSAVKSVRASRAFSTMPAVDGMVLPNGDVYKGEIKDGKKQGKGVYTFKNGDWYSRC
jgi:hypothetical protein